MISGLGKKYFGGKIINMSSELCIKKDTENNTLSDLNIYNGKGTPTLKETSTKQAANDFNLENKTNFPALLRVMDKRIDLNFKNNSG